MSRILRRPLFRGGPASSEGVGITSGLNRPGYNGENGSLVGDEFEKGANMFSQTEREKSNFSGDLLEPGIIESKRQEIANQLNKEAESYKKYINPIGFGGQPEYKRPDISQSMYVQDAINRAKYAETPEGQNKILQNLLTQQKQQAQKYNQLYGDKGEKSQFVKNVINNKSYTEPTKKNEIIPKEEDLQTIYEKYLPMFQKNLGPDQDELTKQKYLELAKFGLNLLKPTPVGIKPSLMGSIASAAEKPLEGYSNILTRESQAKQTPKQLALQAALSESQPGTLGKQVKDMVRLGIAKTPSEAYDLIADKTINAANRLNAQIQIGNLLGQQLQTQFKNEVKNKKIDPDVLAIAGSQIAQHNNNPKGHKIEITDVEILPANPIEGHIYLIPSGPGAGKVGKYKSGKLIYPGETGF